jgi:hypothetical protein
MRNIILGALVALGCSVNGIDDSRFPDGSKRDAPVMADELEGKWCDPRPARILCFEAYGGAYAWLGADCFETGLLFGGLEFSPDAKTMPSRCFGDLDLYSASVDWSDKGLVMHIDGESQPLSLTYVRQ